MLDNWPIKLSFASEIARGYNGIFRLRVQGLTGVLGTDGWVGHSPFDQLECREMHGTKPQ